VSSSPARSNCGFGQRYQDRVGPIRWQAVLQARHVRSLPIVGADARTIGRTAGTTERQSDVEGRWAGDLDQACDAGEWLSAARELHVVLVAGRTPGYLPAGCAPERWSTSPANCRELMRPNNGGSATASKVSL
jgi:hypothetical protein